MPPEIFETFAGTFVTFVDEGLFILRLPANWEFHPRGSILWDGLHQEVYRNGRAERRSAEDLQEKAIPLPSAGLEGVPLAKPMRWEENVRAETPFEKIPGRLKPILTESADPKTLFLVLYEDRYDTVFGDGKYLYPKALFWEEDEAEAFIRSQPPPGDLGNPYSFKKIVLKPYLERKVLTSELNIKPYEHYSIDDILRLLDGIIR